MISGFKRFVQREKLDVISFEKTDPSAVAFDGHHNPEHKVRNTNLEQYVAEHEYEN